MTAAASQAPEPGLAASPPMITGPIPSLAPLGHPSRDYPKAASMVELQDHGYVEQEFIMQGVANSYQTAPLQTARIASSGHGYKTRLLVRRPLANAAFNGTVIMEIANAPLGHIETPIWTATQDMLVREGYAYVRVTALERELDAFGSGLGTWNPQRYGSLDVSDGGTTLDNALALDIITHAAMAIRQPIPGAGTPLLGGLEPRRLIATGAAAAQRQLVRYYNGIQPRRDLIDGFLLYLGQGDRLRTDLTAPVFKVNTETDLVHGFEYQARQPDSPSLRTWEIAGASHVSARDVFLQEPMLIRDGRGVYDFEDGCGDWTKSRIPTHFALKAALQHLLAWTDGGPAPPTAPRIQVEDATGPVLRLARDDYGNVLGGLRLPSLAVPTAMNRGVNGIEQYPCYLYGWYGPFGQDTLESLYPDQANYFSLVVDAANASLRQGHILPEDAQAIIANARRSIETRHLLLAPDKK